LNVSAVIESLSLFLRTARAETVEFAVSLKFHSAVDTHAAAHDAPDEGPWFLFTHIGGNSTEFRVIRK
jgi:hypothetical protein